jgi:predicted Fe-Mo cluster-binding NifX family protein
LHFATQRTQAGQFENWRPALISEENRFSYLVIHGWHETRIIGGVLIAVPNCQGRVSPVFDVAARLLVVRLKGEAELERREVVLFEDRPEGIVRSLRELGINVLICGGISQGLQVALEQVGIRVLGQICGEIDVVVSAYRAGGLNRPEFIMPGCCGRRWGAPDGTPRCRRRRSSRPVR